MWWKSCRPGICILAFSTWTSATTTRCVWLNCRCVCEVFDFTVFDWLFKHVFDSESESESRWRRVSWGWILFKRCWKGKFSVSFPLRLCQSSALMHVMYCQSWEFGPVWLVGKFCWEKHSEFSSHVYLKIWFIILRCCLLPVVFVALLSYKSCCWLCVTLYLYVKCCTNKVWLIDWFEGFLCPSRSAVSYFERIAINMNYELTSCCLSLQWAVTNACASCCHVSETTQRKETLEALMIRHAVEGESHSRLFNCSSSTDDCSSSCSLSLKKQH